MGALLALHSRVCLGAKISGSLARLGEKAAEDWLDDGAKDNLSTHGHWKRHPEDKNELEGVVEG